VLQIRGIVRPPAPIVNEGAMRQNLRAMNANEPLSYTETEVRSYLPSGWNLTDDGPGAWDPKKKIWQTTVLDNVEYDYPVVVKPADAQSHGRIEALRRAFDRVYRERLG